MNFGQTIHNRHFTIQFDKATGKLSAMRPDGKPVVSGAFHAIYANGHFYKSNSVNYSYSVRRNVKSNANQSLVVIGYDRQRKLNFENRITLSDSLPIIEIEVIYENVSSAPIDVGSIMPVSILESDQAYLRYPHAKKCLTNGAMYYDAGMIHTFGNTYKKPAPYGESKGGIALEKSLLTDSNTVQSWWNLGIFSDYGQESMVIGYTKTQNSLGRLQVLKNNNQDLSLIVESVFNPGFTLGKSQKISSDKCIIVLGSDPYSALESYAAEIARETVKTPSHIVNGWCNWFYTLDAFDEKEILRNASFASKILKPYGLEYIQIDEGFQTTHGEWQSNNRFPHGLKWLCDSIKVLGLKPGIWLAPFVISENSVVYKNHPEWLIQDENGTPKRIGPWPNEETDWYKSENPKRYCLDISQPDAEKWYAALVDTVANLWGFEMIKVDFVAWTVFSANRFHNPSASPAQVYSKAMEIMRKVAGENCHILDCGPGLINFKNINSMRIEYDQNYGYATEAWKQYFEGPSSSAGAAGKRYYFHDKIWVNDIDHICLDLLPTLNAQAAATLIALSGGNVISGDRLMDLSESKIDILKKVFPGTIENARPVDLLENDPPTVFASHLAKDSAEWDLVAFFNPDRDKQIQKQFSLDRFWLDTTKTYLCFDFWNERFIGEFSKNFAATVLPGNVSLYSFREKAGVPQVVATNRHIKQGVVELENVYFDKKNNRLTGRSVSPSATRHSVFIYLPDKYYWMPGENKIYQHSEHYSARMVSDKILRIDLFFEKQEKIDWQIVFEEVP